jgi:two-component system, LytTR family, response regulator
MKTKLKILIVDDESPARRRIRGMLKNETRIESVAEAANGDEALGKVLEILPDILFLDIQMPGGNGFQFLEKLRQTTAEKMPVIIFVTAFDEYALQAFDVHATDYLLKPFDRVRFDESFNLAAKRALSTEKEQYRQQILQLLENFQTETAYLEWVSVNKNDKITLFKIEEIRWIEAQGNYALLHLGTLNHLLREKMDSLEKKLNPAKFVRIHRSAIINVDFIKEIQVWGRGEQKIVMPNGKAFSVSKSYRTVFDRFLKQKVL